MKKSSLIIFLQIVIVYGQQKDSINSVKKLDEIVIVKKQSSSGSKVKSGEIVFNKESIKKLPYILGEKDVFKVLQLTPGVQQAKEGQSGLLVRGGNGSMNLICIDDIYLHNAAHFGGIFTAINTDIIHKLTFDKASFDASKGGRLASVTDIVTKSNFEKNNLNVNVGLLTSKATLGFPIKKLKTAVMLSGRRTYFDLLKPLYGSSLQGSDNSLLGNGKTYFFYDYVLKTNTVLNNKNSVSFIVYHTADKFVDEEGVNKRNTMWFNHLVGGNWKYKINDIWNHKLTISNSNYQFYYNGNSFPYQYSYNSFYNVKNIKNLVAANFKNQFFQFGYEFNSTQNLPRNITGSIGNTSLIINNQNALAFTDKSLFIDDKINFNTYLKLKLGIRATNYNFKGNNLLAPFNTTQLEPRISVNVNTRPKEYFKFSFQNLNQFVHQAEIFSYASPIDFYLPVNNNLKQQNSSQYTFGYAKDFKNLFVEIGSYVKRIKNFSEYKNGAISNLFKENIYNDFVTGVLNAYGTELMVQYTNNKIAANVNYTYAKTIATIAEINNGNTYPVTFDRPHNFNVLANYTLNKKWTVGLIFSLNSGQTDTPPKDIKIFNEKPIITYSDKNSYRYPNYHRLDLSVNYTLKEKEDYVSKLNVTLYNLYNRNNPFYIDYQIIGSLAENQFSVNPKIQTFLPFIPSINWILTIE